MCSAPRPRVTPVDDACFKQVARVFVDEMHIGGAEPMVGVISLSMQTIARRLAFAREKHSAYAVSRSQCQAGAHWKTPKSGRFSTRFSVNSRTLSSSTTTCSAPNASSSAQEYAAIADDHPNLVATKNSTDSMQRIRELLDTAPSLQHFSTSAASCTGV